jgi:hypothetical protein
LVVSGGGGGFEDVGIDASFLEEAGTAVVAPVYAYDFFESVAEAAAEGGSLVGGQMEGAQRPDDEAVPGDPEMRERIIYPP